MDKEDVVCTRTHTHTHTMEYYPAIEKNEIMPSVATWVELELSEINQTKTNMVSFICGISKK